MKNSALRLSISSIAIMLIAALALTSCSDNERGKNGAFPEPQTIECQAGELPSFSFTVDESWQLTSNAIWCTFRTPSGKLQDMSGGAGKHTITLDISEDGIKREPTTATITMKMAGKEAVVATVIRAGESLVLTVYNAAGKLSEVIELGYEEYIKFSVEANFRFAATDFPAWVEFEGGAVTGGSGERVECAARIVSDGDRERYAISREDGHVITFADEMGKTTFDIPVVFNGMGDDDITIVSPTGTTFGWEVSLDGKSYRQADSEEEYGGKLQYKIVARNDDYEVICFEMKVERGIPTYIPDAEWIEYDYATSTISIDAATETRYGMVMAFPMGIYNDIKSDIMAAIFELDYSSGIGIETIKYDYLKYTLIDFVQRDFSAIGEEDGMYVYHSLTAYEIPCVEYHNTAIMEQYGVSEGYECPFVNSVEGKKPGVIIDPRIENWNSSTQETGRATAELWYKGEPLKISENEYYVGENKDENMAVHLWGPATDYTENVYIVFKLDGVAKKLLVVTPPVK